MPIVVPCPGCPSKLSAPDSAAGKQIRCPKCGAVAPVPAFVQAEEVQVVEATVARPRPKPVVADADDEDDRPRRRSRRDDEDEDDEPPRRRSRRDDEDDRDDRPRRKKARPRDDEDDYDHDRPRKKKRKTSGTGSGGLVIVLAVLGGLALLGAVGYGVYALFGQGGAFAKKAPPPGWKQYSYPQSGFKAYFPGEPAVFGADVQNAAPPAVIQGVEIPQMESMYSYTSGHAFDQSGKVNVSVSVVRFRSPLPRGSRDPFAANGFGRRGATGDVKKVRWLGGDAAETAVGGTLMRVVYVDRAVITVEISGPNGQRAKPDDEQAFFDNFELTK